MTIKQTWEKPQTKKYQESPTSSQVSVVHNTVHFVYFLLSEEKIQLAKSSEHQLVDLKDKLILFDLQNMFA